MNNLLHLIEKYLPLRVFGKKVINEKIELETTSFVVLDTETTGFDYRVDCILCIGALKLKNNVINVKESFEIYIEQEYYNGTSAVIHGILRQCVLDRLTEKQALLQFLSYIGDSILIAHHAHFDIAMINNALNRNGLPKLKNKTIDTSTLYKESLLRTNLLTKKEQYTLDEIADKFNIEKKDRHTALGDAYITAIVFIRIVDKLKFKSDFNLNKFLV